AARIDRLPEREKSVLQTAAAIGLKFSEPLLRRVCELSQDGFEAAVAALRRAELVHEESLYPDVEYAFRHPLTHEVAERSQLAAQRRRVHVAVARALEELHADKPEGHAALVAHHWDLGGAAEPPARRHRRPAGGGGGRTPADAPPSGSPAATRRRRAGTGIECASWLTRWTTPRWRWSSASSHAS